MKLILTKSLVDKLEIVLALAYNAADGLEGNDPDYYEEIVEAHTAWAKICENAGGEVDYIEEE